MKKYFFGLSLVLLLPLMSFSQQRGKVWTAAEKQFLISGLKSTQSALLREVEGLSEKQMHFKPDSTQWSVAEILEHLGIFEELLFWDLSCNQYTPEQPELVTGVRKNDSIFLAYATDPSKGQSPVIAVPLGRFGNRDLLVKYFNFFRNEVIHLVETTTADFRLHFVYRDKIWGASALRDLYQYTIVYITHTTRHMNQMKRVKANPNFPNK